MAQILHEEQDRGSFRVQSILPAPMRTTLRREAYFGEDTFKQPPPDATAEAIVFLLGAEGARARGAVLDLRQA
jgi:hypothetical protein